MGADTIVAALTVDDAVVTMVIMLTRSENRNWFFMGEKGKCK